MFSKGPSEGFSKKENLFYYLGAVLFLVAYFLSKMRFFSNPTYPFLDTFWGTGEITQRFTETYTREKYFSGLSLDNLLRLPLILVYDIVDGDMNDVLGFFTCGSSCTCGDDLAAK